MILGGLVRVPDVVRAGISVGSFYRMGTNPVRTLKSTRFNPLVIKIRKIRHLTELFFAHHIETNLRMMGSERGWVWGVDRVGIDMGNFYRMGKHPVSIPTSTRLKPPILKLSQKTTSIRAFRAIYRNVFADDWFRKWMGLGRC